jgi:UDP-GlcNAc:undecaprenyl-phosphate GlcNAc-1-phosphate transferase
MMYANTFTILLIIAASFLLSLGAVALVLKLAHKNGWYDRTSERKIHHGEVPRLGGIGFSLAFILVGVTIALIIGDVKSALPYVSCLSALVLVLVLGAWDDFRPIRPYVKFMVQCIAALFVIIPGYTFKYFTFLDMGLMAKPLEYAITFLWIVGLMNAVNFIDGLDGLAGGTSGIIALFLLFIFLSGGEASYIVLICAVLFGVVAGFLVFNLPVPKAKIFMGDGGSHVLGFLLALLPLFDGKGDFTSLPLFYAAALLLIPIFDTTAAVWRRIRDGKRIDKPDMAHVHHKLLTLGLKSQGVIAVLYSLQIVIGIITYISIRLNGLASLYVLGAAYVIVILFFSVIHFKNRAALKADKKEEITNQ